MREAGWLFRLVPAIVAVVVISALALAAASLVVASPVRRVVPAAAVVAPDDVLPATCVADVSNGVNWRGPSVPDARSTPAYRTRLLLDVTGSLIGQRVSIGTLAATSTTLNLPPESFVAGPFGRVVLVGGDDGTRSTLRLVDALSGCVTTIATAPEVIRRATIAPDSGVIYEFRAERARRSDLGVWRRAAGSVERVLPPLDKDDRYGITFSTELSWSTDGDALVVQSCDASRCRSRVLDISRGKLLRIETADQGEILALVGDRLVTYGACRGLPCPIHAFGVTSGDDVVLSDGAADARVVTDADGARVVHERGDGAPGLMIVDPQSGAVTTLAEPPDARLAPPASRSDGAVELPAGWIPLVDRGLASLPVAFVRLSDGRTVDLTGASR
jgi:hypothetical protein